MVTKTKIALVTGSSRGLGKSMALALAEQGVNIIITYNSNKGAADEVVSEIQSLGQQAKAYQLDTSDVSTFDGFIKKVTGDLMEQYGSASFDYLINNAGTSLNARAIDTTESQFDEAVNIDYKGVFFLTQKALPFINDGGAIVNVSSSLARVAFSGSSVYGALKGAIAIHTRYLARELGDRKIRVNAMAPGAIETDFGGGANRDNEELKAYVANITALGRVGMPDEIGSVVAFLCSDNSYWINGQCIELSGGQSL